MKKKMGGELICMRPDIIIEARFKLTKKQNDIMDMVFAKIQEDDNLDNLEYEIDLHKYAKLYNVKDQRSIYSEVKKAVKSFEGKGFYIVQDNDTKEDSDYFPWFSRIKYRGGEAKITIELGKTLKKIFIEVIRAVYYKIEYTINLSCIYSKRIYYYLKLYQDTGERFDNLDVLRKKLECPESYNKYSLFKKNVLNPAYLEINGNSDISFEFEEIKQKNKVTGIKFIIKTNKSKIIKDPERYINTTTINNKTCDEISADTEHTANDLIKQVQSICYKHNITNNEAISMLSDAKNDVELIEERYKYMLTQKRVDNVVGYMRSIISKYDKSQQSKKPDHFNDFEQRNYNYDDLEKKLLGWDKPQEDEQGNTYVQSIL